MWLELSPSHIRHVQLAAVRQIPQGMHDAALLLHRSHVLPCRLRAACLPVAWCHGWVGWGTKIVHDAAVSQGRHVLDRLGLPGSDESDLSVST